MSERPQCGGGGLSEDDYDLPLHIAAVFMVFAFSIGGAGFPVTGKRIRWMRIPPGVLFFCKHFGTGVLVATAFVHLVPTAFSSLTDPCLPALLTEQYPAMPGVIMMTALFALFTIGMYLKAKVGGHSHGGPMGHGTVALAHQGARPGTVDHQALPSYGTALEAESTLNMPTTKSPTPIHSMLTESLCRLKHNEANTSPRSTYEVTPASGEEMEQYNNLADMPPWFQVFYAQYVRQREELKAMVLAITPRAAALPAETSSFDDRGILFHSIFVGMTISITGDGFVVLLIAILFHQFFDGLGLGSRIAAVPYPNKAVRRWILVIAFGLTCPIGQASGLLTRNSYDPSSAFALILVGAFNAFSSGLLIYAATVDLLAEDFLSEEAQLTLTKKD
ncbi:hypothetical protein G647_05363 [Cladophialophora carrionii CBS 160.54]|uniref:Zinc/iron permease n=1 Tax=Cladophialophora carrionii CBS 160.54 TaxID=1279043 RepID=V9DA52_9EURO|nr:uncharacterized protein G647_05363 [Cladophialophora carrionii CBS 160.54]ETI23561.1 hypothetical protein G647_05363 [Cladophialophora carrionii CBS 160.54]